ncbi:zinc finger matrin-type protein 5 isoform X2 [Hermetia illucens]|uniref:zinc finger matrin-type protein 5 isoform X2 n=1 Tax=Hermetia illucens TaxID=343691 RepID=UPI0018CC7971|nr:zinc finger matrin-type protein 5 isoform X2 [Hermetia illucens]
MGRNYYCEYCDKRMKCSVSIRKSHNEGLPHKIAKAEYMARFKDPRDILAEERKKTPCSRFLTGKECKFGMFCHFSHYRMDQLKELERIEKMVKQPPKTEQIQIEKKNTDHKFPWKYPHEKVQNKSLPPSLQPYDIEKCFSITNDTKNRWG